MDVLWELLPEPRTEYFDNSNFLKEGMIIFRLWWLYLLIIFIDIQSICKCIHIESCIVVLQAKSSLSKGCWTGSTVSIDINFARRRHRRNIHVQGTLCATLPEALPPREAVSQWGFAICLVDGRLAEFYSSDMRYMDVSENSGTPKSSILIGFSSINQSILGYPYFWKHSYWDIISVDHFRISHWFIWILNRCLLWFTLLLS